MFLQNNNYFNSRTYNISFKGKKQFKQCKYMFENTLIGVEKLLQN